MSLSRWLFITIALALALSAAWMKFGPRREPASPVARSSGESPEQSSPNIAQEANVNDEPIDQQLTRADQEADTTGAVPIDLTGLYGMKAAAFDRNTRYPWPAVPRGLQTFANVPLDIGGAMMLWGERNSAMGLNFPEQITGIPVERKFETLYILHATFFEDKPGTPVYEVVFRYDDGTSAAEAIVSGGDTRDWFADRAKGMFGPSSPRSTLAWDADAKMGERTQPIRFCLTAIANPHPDKEVTTIDLVSSRSQAAACILAMTTGGSGLMRRTEESPGRGARDE